ncbi:MAG: hypothetical protein JWO98_217 [Frankiales bacterium]|nr:hypothetical protein [Frankiales bacterium]
MGTSLLMLTEVICKDGEQLRCASAWAAASPTTTDRSYYRALDDNSVLELMTVAPNTLVNQLKPDRQRLAAQLAPYLTGDFRRQLLRFVEAPKEAATPTPQTPYLQLRHIEVPLERLGEYRDWRDRTIFDVVRRSPQVEEFGAYHTLISTEPGVMFVSGFSCDVDKYMAVFDSEEYRDIIRQAGPRYITGERGLYTKMYSHVVAA